jgi:hypothetical protein
MTLLCEGQKLLSAIPWSVAKRHHNEEHTCSNASIPQSLREFIEANSLTHDGGTRRLFIETTIIASAKMFNLLRAHKLKM